MENYAVLVKSLFDLLTFLQVGFFFFFFFWCGERKYLDFLLKDGRTTTKFTTFVSCEWWKKKMVGLYGSTLLLLKYLQLRGNIWISFERC